MRVSVLPIVYGAIYAQDTDIGLSVEHTVLCAPYEELYSYTLPYMAITIYPPIDERHATVRTNSLAANGSYYSVHSTQSTHCFMIVDELIFPFRSFRYDVLHRLPYLHLFNS